MNNILRVIFVAVVSCCAFPSYSSSLVDADSVVDRRLGEVSVVASRRSEILAPQRIEGSRLRLLSAHSVADAIRYVAGTQIKDYGGVGGLKTVDIRSMGSNHLGVFYDGLPIGNAQNGTVDLGRFSLDNMEEVAVYNGQKSELLQPARDFGTSGSIYLKTRQPVFSHSRRQNVHATAKGGSFGLANGALLYERMLGSAISLSCNAEYLHADGKYRFRYHKVLKDTSGHHVVAWDTTGTRQNGDVQALRVEGSLFGTMRDASWHVKAYVYDSERGIPRAIVRNVWTSSQRQWDRNIFIQGNMRKSFGIPLDMSHVSAPRLSEMLFSAKYSRDFLHYINPDTTSLYVDNRFTQHSIYSSLANTWRLGQLVEADVSVDYDRSWMSSDMASFAYPVRNTFLAALAAALKTDRLKIQASLLGNFIADHSKADDTSRSTHRLTPSLFVSYDIPVTTAHLSLHAFAKRAFRMPTFNDLYYTDIGNISLRPEYATQFDVGARYIGQWGVASSQISADYYHNMINDKIIAVPKGNSQYRWMMMNIGRVTIDGVDVALRNKFTLSQYALLSFDVTYTFQKALDKTNPSDNGPRGTYNGQISYIPRHSGSAVAGIEVYGWHLNYSFIYVGERYHVSANIPENYEPSWYTHDVNIGRQLSFGDKLTISISAEANNILNQQYDVVLNYPMPGRNWKAILKIGW